MRRHAALLLLAGVLVTGCGSGASLGGGQQAAAATSAPSPTELPSDGPIPDAFLGTWTVVRDSGTQSHGTWTLRITREDMQLLNPVAKSDAEFFSLNPRAATEEGVSFYTDPDCLGASYRWSLAGDALTFTTDHADSCIDRYWTLTGDPWHRSTDASPSAAPLHS
jgi:hypothetical protein